MTARVGRATPASIAWVSIALPLLAAAPLASAQDETVCADVALHIAKPATAEWTEWLGIGGGWGTLGTPGEHADLVVRAGGAVDFELGQIGSAQQYGGPVELRMGPWVGADGTFGESAREPLVALEGGLSLDVGQTSHAQWGDFALRVGAGVALGSLYAASTTVPSGSITLTWGVRSVPDRYRWGGGCVTERGIEAIDTGAPASEHALASGARLFGTVRVDGDAVYTLLLGIELEPSFFFPPYTDGRWIGAPP
ncbi:MAG: hypothetical protein U0234_28850 [Sandaracinus sp.]